MKSLSLNPTILRTLPPAGRYLVGVSGGRDSVALLHCLIEQGYRDLIVCHLNHQLRGRAGEADARFVAKLAARLGISAETGSTDVRALATRKKISTEAAAREARYSFFAKTARRRRCSTIFLGHHADDLVETFLINLFRGAGTGGLSAMRETSTRRVDSVDLVIVRPFLGIWRRDIDGYVKKHRLKFREDASNKDLTPLRNRVRRRIIPYLEKSAGRNIRVNVWRTAMIVAEEDNFFETLFPERPLGAAALAVESLRKMSLALQRRTLHKWLRAGQVAEVGFDLVERVRGLLDLASGVAKTNLPRNRHARRRAGKIFLE
jgi:tRNA(Ile)-lysidine synthase